VALAISPLKLTAPVAGPLLSYTKAEFVNPGGSVKDRPALNMILDGERTGRLRPGRIVLDATSGNTGIAYAMIGAPPVDTRSVSACQPTHRTEGPLSSYVPAMPDGDPDAQTGGR